MPNIKLLYRYRDYANYKNHGSAVFANPDNLTLAEVEATLRAACMDDEYFIASRWLLRDLHFDTYDAENDHPWHELEGLELTDEAITEPDSITELLNRAKGANCYW